MCPNFFRQLVIIDHRRDLAVRYVQILRPATFRSVTISKNCKKKSFRNKKFLYHIFCLLFVIRRRRRYLLVDDSFLSFPPDNDVDILGGESPVLFSPTLMPLISSTSSAARRRPFDIVAVLLLLLLLEDDNDVSIPSDDKWDVLVRDRSRTLTKTNRSKNILHGTDGGFVLYQRSQQQSYLGNFVNMPWFACLYTDGCGFYDIDARIDIIRTMDRQKLTRIYLFKSDVDRSHTCERIWTLRWECRKGLGNKKYSSVPQRDNTREWTSLVQNYLVCLTVDGWTQNEDSNIRYDVIIHEAVCQRIRNRVKTIPWCTGVGVSHKEREPTIVNYTWVHL